MIAVTAGAPFRLCFRLEEPTGESDGASRPTASGQWEVRYLLQAADDRPEKVRASYGENYARLRALKAAYDPKNLFRVNANIAP